MNRFFIYKEYGAKYEMMMRDIASVQRAMPASETYQRGFEILASSLGSEKSRTEYARKKASTISDLLVKVSLILCPQFVPPRTRGRGGALPLTQDVADTEDVQVPPDIC